jgi:hypothetical protein
VAERETIRIAPDSSQLKGVYKAFKTLSDEANKQLKDDVAEISKWTAGEIKAAAAMAPYMPKQAARVAETVKFNRDRVPNVTIGGSKKNFSGGAKAVQVLFGSEFGAEPYLARRVNGSNRGANTFGKYGGKRFPPRSPDFKNGSEGYWIYPTLRREQSTITARWRAAVDRVLGNWGN